VFIEIFRHCELVFGSFCMSNILQVDATQALDKETFNQLYGFPGQPVLFKGLASQWPALHLWSLEFLDRKLGDSRVNIRKTGASHITREISLTEFLKYMQDCDEAAPFYMTDWQFRKQHAWLCNDYQVPDYFDSWLERLPAKIAPDLCWLYAGPKSSGSALHTDTLMTSAWNAVISGRKQWRFFSPDQGENLYHGEVDAFGPDLLKFPRFANAGEAIECVQEPGDVVFTPSGWWHQVLNLQAGVSLTQNFLNETNCKLAQSTLEQYFPQFLLKFHIPEMYA